ncbi:KINESIN-LIKE PROTEIN KIN-12B [Salix koriyanagi]|uniref:KINESIN-LIKE PROTEIN KIN-12B n=1 Tax=Salix koriyanagi TaxID=2511006 RepID=A0A9Q0W2L7_9ROSI|nr:KINESIN-LIKE PROTEIN KIN-12B [Salix koriyanagi]
MSSAIYPSQTTGLPQSFRLYFMELSSRSNVFHGFWKKVDILHQEWYVCLRISGGSSSGSFEASTLLFSQNHQKAQKTKPAGSNPILPVDVGVQTFPLDDEISERLFLCTNCKAKTQLEVKDVGDSSTLQLVPIYCSESIEKPKTQVPKAVEKVLAGAIRREMALEEFCAKQAYEIMQLNRLVQQCKHERECNSIIGQTREDEILRVESLMDGILSTKDFMEEELAALIH